MGAAAGDRVARDHVSRDDLVQDDGVLDDCDVPDWLRRALGLSAEWGGSALVRLVLFRVAPFLFFYLFFYLHHTTPTSTILPSQPDDRRAGDSLGQEPELGTGVISDRIRAYDAYAPEQPGNAFGPRDDRSLPGTVARHLGRPTLEAGKP